MMLLMSRSAGHIDQMNSLSQPNHQRTGNNRADGRSKDDDENI